MLFVDVIQKKRDGEELTTEEIEFFVKGLADSSIPSEQVAALAMAVIFRSMTAIAMHDLDPVFEKFSYRPELGEIARSIGIANPGLLQSMYIFKPPRIGGEVHFHQDSLFRWRPFFLFHLLSFGRRSGILPYE